MASSLLCEKRALIRNCTRSRVTAVCVYSLPVQFCKDMWLTFDNAWLYNKKTSRVYKYCSKLSEVFDQYIDDAMKSLGYCCGRRVSSHDPLGRTSMTALSTYTYPTWGSAHSVHCCALFISLVPRLHSPAFLAPCRKAGREPGIFHHVLRRMRGLVCGFVNQITRDVYRCACGSSSESINCRAIVTKQQQTEETAAD